MLIVTQKGRNKLPPGVDRTRLEVRVFSVIFITVNFSLASHHTTQFSLFALLSFTEAPVTWWIPGCLWNVHPGIWPPFSMEEKRPEEESVSLLVVSQKVSHKHCHVCTSLARTLDTAENKDWDMQNVLEPAKKKSSPDCSYVKQSQPTLWSLYQFQLCLDFSRVTNFASSLLCVLSKARIIYTDINAASRLQVDLNCAGNLADQIFAEISPDGPV